MTPHPGAAPSTTIRRIGPAHVDLVVDLFLAYLEFYGRPAARPAARDFLHDRLTRAESIILLAERDGTAAGFVQVYPSFSSLSMAPAWTLNDLFVSPAARRTGLGRALIEAVLAEATAAGAVSVALETAQDNTTAQALYAATGFTSGAAVRHYVRALPTD